MANEDEKKLQQHQNIDSSKYENTPQNVISNAARFNKQFHDSQSCPPIVVHKIV